MVRIGRGCPAPCAMREIPVRAIGLHRRPGARNSTSTGRPPTARRLARRSTSTASRRRPASNCRPQSAWRSTRPIRNTRFPSCRSRGTAAGRWVLRSAVAADRPGQQLEQAVRPDCGEAGCDRSRGPCAGGAETVKGRVRPCPQTSAFAEPCASPPDVAGGGAGLRPSRGGFANGPVRGPRRPRSGRRAFPAGCMAQIGGIEDCQRQKRRFGRPAGRGAGEAAGVPTPPPPPPAPPARPAGRGRRGSPFP